MKLFSTATVLVFAFILNLSLDANAQQRERFARTKQSSPVVTIAKGTGRVALIVVGSTAYRAYKVTKVVAKEVAKPVVMHFVRPVLAKAGPQIGRFALRNALKFGLPLALKLSLL